VGDCVGRALTLGAELTEGDDDGACFLYFGTGSELISLTSGSTTVVDTGGVVLVVDAGTGGAVREYGTVLGAVSNERGLNSYAKVREIGNTTTATVLHEATLFMTSIWNSIWDALSNYCYCYCYCFCYCYCYCYCVKGMARCRQVDR
jgi:hypothetical protein